ncbi:TlpA family protein disulfide reductase [Halostagnicola bangensis]
MDPNRPAKDSSGRATRSPQPRNGGWSGVARRQYLRASTAMGVGALAAFAGCLDDGSDSDPDDDRSESETSGSGPSPPFDIRTIDARGSESGESTIPEEDTILVVSFSRTQCPTSEGQVSDMSEAFAEVTTDSVQFLTVNDWTRGPADTDEELAEWWETETDGEWLLGIDEGGVASDYYDAVSLPETIVIDGDGEVSWSYSGESGSSRLLGAIDDAVNAEDETE